MQQAWRRWTASYVPPAANRLRDYSGDLAPGFSNRSADYKPSGKTVTGDSGDNYLPGDGDDDRLEGGPGNDTLNGVHSDNTMWGGPGNDVLHGETFGTGHLAMTSCGAARVTTCSTAAPAPTG